MESMSIDSSAKSSGTSAAARIRSRCGPRINVCTDGDHPAGEPSGGALQALEALRVSFDHYSPPALEGKRIAIRTITTVPGTELAVPPRYARRKASKDLA